MKDFQSIRKGEFYVCTFKMDSVCACDNVYSLGYSRNNSRKLLQLITLPINILTLGIFGLILNALLLMFAGWVSPGFEVDGFLSAFIGSIVISLLSLGINLIDKQNA